MLQPLTWNVPITNKDGTPTNEFMRKWLQQQAQNTGIPTGANPTATAADTAVNGTATTFMRSDAAPAVQKASSSAFGIAKVDGTTITATGGVLSVPGLAATTFDSNQVVAGNTTPSGGAISLVHNNGDPVVWEEMPSARGWGVQT